MMQTALRGSFIGAFASETKGRAHVILHPPGRQRLTGRIVRWLPPPHEITMRALFIDCNDQLAPVWRQVVRADDPKIDVNLKPFAREDLPRVVGPYPIVLD